LIILKEWIPNAFHLEYTWRNKSHWTPVVTPEGSTYLVEEWTGLKGQNLDADDLVNVSK
jgi:hypothetical protein